MELFIIGLLVGAGAAKGKSVTKAVAKGYMAVTEVTKTAAISLRADMNDAIEEARYEREQDEDAPAISAADRDTEAAALHEETARPKVERAAAQSVGEVAAGKPKTSLNLMKSLMKGYVAVAEKTKGTAASLREDVRDAIEEARYEREQAALRATQAETESEAAEPVVLEVVSPAPVAEPIVAEQEPPPRTKRPYTKRTPAVTPQTPAPPAKTRAARKADSAAAPATTPTGRARTTRKAADTPAPAATAPAPTPARRGRPPKSASQGGRAAETRALETIAEIAEVAGALA